VLNGLIHGDDATDITDTAATTRIAQLSDEIILELYNLGKTTGVPNPWESMTLNLSLARINSQYRWVIKKIQKDLGYDKPELTSSDLPKPTTRTY
jgi:hypothetical protein